MAVYLTNKDLKREIEIYQNECEKSEELPKFREEIGEMFVLMAKRIGDKPNFRNYTNLEDMKGEAAYKCLKAVKNFNLDRNTSAFSYFTQIIFMSFLQDIGKLKIKAREIPVDFIDGFNSTIDENMKDDISYESYLAYLEGKHKNEDKSS
jgi:hypothetical protein